MIIPSYGRVVIVDDKIEEVKSLMTALSKHGISYTYFDGQFENLPSSPLKGITFMFLDLELDNNSLIDNKTKASQDINVIKHILGEDASTHSVVIIVWSGYSTILAELKSMMHREKVFPLALLEINKADCKENGEFRLDKVESEIEKQLSRIHSLDLLAQWDNLVGQASNSVYKKILPTRYLELSELNKHLNTIYKHLAVAQLGEKNLDKDKAYAAIYILNSILANEISNMSNNGACSTELDLGSINVLGLEDLGRLNASINMVSFPECTRPGCVFSDFAEQKVTGFDIFKDKDEAKSKHKKEYKNMVNVCCEVTPLCDYAQKRAVYRRFVSGLVVPTVFIDDIKEKSDYLYKSPIFYVDGFFNNAPFFLVLDLRHFFTTSLTELEDKQPLFQLAEPLIMHIQNRLGRQVSNPGITYISNSKENGNG